MLQNLKKIVKLIFLILLLAIVSSCGSGPGDSSIQASTPGVVEADSVIFTEDDSTPPVCIYSGHARTDISLTFSVDDFLVDDDDVVIEKVNLGNVRIIFEEIYGAKTVEISRIWTYSINTDGATTIAFPLILASEKDSGSILDYLTMTGSYDVTIDVEGDIIVNGISYATKDIKFQTTMDYQNFLLSGECS